MIPAHHVPHPPPNPAVPSSPQSSSTFPTSSSDNDAGPSTSSTRLLEPQVTTQLRDLTLDNERFVSGHRSASSSMEHGDRSPRDRKGKSPVRGDELTGNRGAGQRVEGGEMKDDAGDTLFYRAFRSEEEDLEGMMRLIEAELSEPYNIYTFRYFLMEWPHLTLLVFPSPSHPNPIATIVCKQDTHRGKTNRGYIAMLSVDKAWRRRGIASGLVKRVIEEMTTRGAHEIVLETEVDNDSSLALYDALGFVREKRLHRFYTNGKDAFRLILPLETHPLAQESDDEADQARHFVGQGPQDWDAFERDWDSLHGTREGELLRMIAEEEQGRSVPFPPLHGQTAGGGAAADGWRPPVPPRQSAWEGLYT